MRSGRDLYFAPERTFRDMDPDGPHLPSLWQSRMTSYYLEPALAAVNANHGFAAGLLVVSAIDAIARLHYPHRAPRATARVFRRFLVEELESFRAAEVAIAFYDRVRCGLVHEGRLKYGAEFDLSLDRTIAVEDEILSVNPGLLRDEVIAALSRYVRALEEDPGQRANFAAGLKRDLAVELGLNSPIPIRADPPAIRPVEITLDTRLGPRQAVLAHLVELTDITLREPLEFLHCVRSPAGQQQPEAVFGHLARAYYDRLPEYMSAFAAWADQQDFDLLIVAPSERRDAEPFAATIRAGHADATDASRLFAKAPGAKAGSAQTKAEFDGRISLTKQCSFTTYRSVAVIDDVYARGFTAASIVDLLAENGLPQEATVTVCAPVKIALQELRTA